MNKSKSKYQPPFETGKFYHIYNRANNQDLLFYEKRNYRYFLRKYDEYLSEFLNTFAYCMIPNHFHFMAQVKNLDNSTPVDLDKKIREQFRRFFITYSQAINRQENRKGSLFQKPFKRKLIDERDYFTQLIFYIHHNPVHHSIFERLQDYRWSSYPSIISNKDSKLSREEVLRWFGGKDKFVDFHENYQAEKVNQKILFKT